MAYASAIGLPAAFSEQTPATIIDAAIPAYSWRAEVDASGRVVVLQYSRMVETVTGRPLEYFEGGLPAWLGMVHEDDLPRMRLAVEAVLTGTAAEEVREEENRIVRPDGTVRWIRNYLAIQRAMGSTTIEGVTIDVHDRKLAEEALRDSEERFRVAAEHATDYILEYDIESGQLSQCDAVGRDLGYEPGEIPTTRRALHQLIHPDDQERVKALGERCLRTGENYYAEYRVVHKDGSVRHHVNRGCLVTSASGAPRKWIFVCSDVTAQRAVEEAESRLAAIVRSSDDAIIGQDPDGRIESWNHAAEDLYGYSESEVRGQHVSILADPGQVDELLSVLEKVKGGCAVHYETVRRKKDGAVVPVWLTASPVQVAGRVIGISTIARDISAFKKASHELKESQKRLRKLLARREQDREAERIRLARELHDELGQALTVLKMDVDALAKLCTGAESRARAASIHELIDKTIQSVQEMSSELRPSLLDNLGLTAALEWLLREFQKRTGIVCRLEAAEQDPGLGTTEATAVYRIVQELLTNVARHAGATAVEILMKRSRATLQLVVRDNGWGIGKNHTSNSNSLGIMGMRERASLLGGAISFKGVRGKGTTVTLRVPLMAASPQPANSYMAVERSLSRWPERR